MLGLPYSYALTKLTAGGSDMGGRLPLAFVGGRHVWTQARADCCCVCVQLCWAQLCWLHCADRQCPERIPSDNCVGCIALIGSILSAFLIWQAHCDIGTSIFLMVQGRKRWVLYPPSQSQYMYPYGQYRNVAYNAGPAWQ